MTENLTLDCSSWRKLVHNGKRDFEQNRVAHKKLKKHIKGIDINFPENIVTESNM